MKPRLGKLVVSLFAALVGVAVFVLCVILHARGSINDADFVILAAIGLEILFSAIIGLDLWRRG